SFVTPEWEADNDNYSQEQGNLYAEPVPCRNFMFADHLLPSLSCEFEYQQTLQCSAGCLPVIPAS
ncbi:TPA: hypothetical protein ACMEXA_006086, partial [Klebsiella variicola subsp. variicola]